ncbi:MAG: redoxin domain-containing protein [Planctomycetota bacterium]
MSFSPKLLTTGLVCSLFAVTVLIVRAQSGDTAAKKSGAAAFSLADRFKELDKNSDEKLSRAELGPALFEFLNANRDDSVTLDEAREVIREKGFDALQKVAQGQSAKSGAVSRETKPGAAVADEPLRQGPVRVTPGDHGVGRMVPDLKLTDIDGRSFKLSDLKEDRAVVIAFTNTSCPICKKYAPTLAALEKQFAEKQVAFVFVNPTASDKLDDIQAAIRSHGFAGHYVRDNDGAVASTLAATHTTDAIVLDAKRTVVYRGAVDDQYGFGYSKEVPRATYLVDAIEATLAGERPNIAATSAPGCPLDFESAKQAASTSTVTYHNRVSRIVQDHCLTCHRDGGVAPFALSTFDEVTGQSGSIRRVVEKGIMPPWFAAPPAKGEVTRFANDCSLASADKAELLAWLNGGKPVGDPRDAPLPRSFASGWQIGKPDLLVQLPSPISVKATGTMPYQNVIVESGLTETKYVKAVEVKPTAREVVHHVLVFVLPPTKRGGEATDKTEGDGEEDESTGFFAAYAPGYDALHFNDGYGKVLPAGSRLKFQIHYTPNGTATTDRPMIGMIFADKRPEHLVSVQGISQPRFAIPPGADNHEVVANQPVPNEATILAFFPHMHLRGKAFKYEAILPNGETQVLLDIPRYDFNWQLSYRLAEPLTLPAGSTIRATAWYDNSDKNPANPDSTRTVRWGPQTYDEMMIGYIEYHMGSDQLQRSGPLLGLAAGFDFEALFKRLDKNNDGLLKDDELPARGRDRLLQLDKNGDGAISQEEMRRLKR